MLIKSEEHVLLGRLDTYLLVWDLVQEPFTIHFFTLGPIRVLE